MEIGTSMVRLAEAQRRGKKVEILDTFVFDTPDDATKDGKIRMSEELISAIRDGIDESGMKSTDVYFVVESTKILFKQVKDIPAVPKNKILGMLTYSFSDYFPVDETLYHIAYKLERTYEKNGKKMMALDVFAIPNDLSESYYNLSVALGLNAKGLSDTSRSMVSLFPDTFKSRNVAMININEAYSTLSIVTDGDMIFNKTIPYGVYDAIRQVMNTSMSMDNIDVTTAVEQLSSQPVLMRHLPQGLLNPNDENEKLRYNVTASIVSLVKTIETHFTAFLSKENIMIQEFQLSGLGAGFVGISPLLANEYDLPVTVIQQDGNLMINAQAAHDPLLLSCYPCVGAVLDEINFFTEAEQKGGEVANKKKRDRAIFMICVLASMGLGVYSALNFLEADAAHAEAEHINKELNATVKNYRDMGVEESYNNYVTAVSYHDEVKGLYEQSKSVNEKMLVFLNELEELLPLGARVIAMNLSPERAEISFRCEDKYVAAGVLHLLRNMKTIVKFDCPNAAEIEGTDDMAFTATFTLKSEADLAADEETPEGEQENPDGTNDENQNNETEIPEESQLLIDMVQVNTAEIIDSVDVGESTFALSELSDEIVEELGLTVEGGVYSKENEALTMTGLTYATEDGAKIHLSQLATGEYNALAIVSPQFSVYNGIHVGMISDDVFALIDVTNFTDDGRFAILKNLTTTLVVEINTETGVVDSIYIIKNKQEVDAPIEDDLIDDTVPDDNIGDIDDEAIPQDEDNEGGVG